MHVIGEVKLSCLQEVISSHRKSALELSDALMFIAYCMNVKKSFSTLLAFTLTGNF